MTNHTFGPEDWKAINTIRALSIDMVQKANSGHPGLPLGAAPMAYVLWHRFLKTSHENLKWYNRDRFILSPGHGSALLYSLMHCFGEVLSIDDLKNFRQWKSKTPGHPESFMTPGVECTTGPLGQGIANAVGFAMAEIKQRQRFPELIDHYTYAIISDGDIMEGISYEAASIAGQLQLGKLICLYDANDICLDGNLDMTFTENVEQRFLSQGWDVHTIKDGDKDLSGIAAAIIASQQATTKPSIIIVKTTIGYGSPNKAGSSSSHGSPLGAEEIALTKKALEVSDIPEFTVPPEVKETFDIAVNKNLALYKSWSEKATTTPSFQNLDSENQFQLPQDWHNHFPEFESGKAMATRVSSGQVLNAVANALPNFFGGDADLSCSTKTGIKEGGAFSNAAPQNKNIHYGVREHAMGAIANGIAYYGGLRTYTATFFCFSDYMKPAIRLAAMNHLPVTYIFTHDSVALGEDGPTHQPVEHLLALRAIPNCLVLRPGDANEVKHAWIQAMNHTTGPTCLVLSRQNVETLNATQGVTPEQFQKGAYVLKESTNPALTLFASGSELGLALQVANACEAKGQKTQVVSCPSPMTFLKQNSAYQQEVKSTGLVASIEAGSTLGWHAITGNQGNAGLQFGIDEFGHSAPGKVIMENMGLSVEKISGVLLNSLGQS